MVVEPAQEDPNEANSAVRDDNRELREWRQTICESGKIDDALAAIAAAINANPTDADHYLHRGFLHCEQENWEAALTDFSEAIRLSPENVDAYRWRAHAQSRLEDFDEAISTFDRALELTPDDANLRLNRGAALYQTQDYDAAIEDLTASIRHSPDDPAAYTYRALCHFELSEFDEAIEDYGRANRLDPANSKHLFDRAQVWEEIDEWENAITDYTEAIRVSPDDLQAYKARAEAWNYVGERHLAIHDYQHIEQRGEQADKPMTKRMLRVHALLDGHFQPISLELLAITERCFPARFLPDLQLAIDELLNTLSVHHFCGVQHRYCNDAIRFGDLVVRTGNDPAVVVAPSYLDVDIGEEKPARCLRQGLWLVEDRGTRFAILLDTGPGDYCSDARFQVAAVNDETGKSIFERVFEHLENAVREAKSYRGKILSLEFGNRYSGQTSGIKVHKLHPVVRDQVILPRQTLELLVRNVIHFVEQRPRLAAMGMPTKKGLLFYGPPGTGKTHTIHYLAGALKGTTTLLITAEQVGLLDHYVSLARLLQPSMIVIEDADLIARDRLRMHGGCEEVLLNKLLNEMDGLRENADILFILTTNRPEMLEPALASRPGRIDQAIEFPFPDEEGRTKLVRLYSRGNVLSDDALKETVRRTENVSAAFIKELMRRSAQFRLEREGATEISIADVNNALEELLFSGGSLNRALLGASAVAE